MITEPLTIQGIVEKAVTEYRRQEAQACTTCGGRGRFFNGVIDGVHGQHLIPCPHCPKGVRVGAIMERVALLEAEIKSLRESL